MPQELQVILTQKDVKLAQDVARLRNSKLGLVPNNRQSTKHSDYNINVVGLLGEIAVAKVLNVDIDRSFSMSGDGGVDISYENHTIDVKTTRYHRSLLIVNFLDEIKSDMLVLCRVDPIVPTNVYILGVVSARKFRRDHRQKKINGKNKFVMRWRDLKPISDWIYFVETGIVL